MLKLWSLIFSNGSKKRFLVYFPAVSVVLSSLTHGETEAQRKKKLSQGHSTKLSCEPWPDLACVLPTLPSIMCGRQDLGQRLGGWGVGPRNWATLGCDPGGSTDHPPSGLASPAPLPSASYKGNSREEKAAVFLLPSGLSRSQHVQKSSPGGAGKDGVAGAGL